MIRLFSALVILCALIVLPALPAGAQQKADTKPKADTQPKADNKQKADNKTFTAEQVVESVILVYGTRPGLEHIRRNGIERGKIIRFNAEGTAEEANYERRFVRGESLDKDKIRLDQKLPTMEYSLVYGGGKLWGLINGAAFTPRQDAAANFLSQHLHSIDSLLRYKECGSTITLIGKEQQKGLDLYVVELVDKEKRKTKFYISARTLRILWLEYEDVPSNGGITLVKYTRRFLDYRAVQQTLVPYHMILLEDGKQTQEVHVMTVTYGSKLDDSIFTNPSA